MTQANDIVVFDRYAQVHQERLLKVMDRLLEYGLTLSEKCEFGLPTVKFLGHIISGEGISKFRKREGYSVCESVH